MTDANRQVTHYYMSFQLFNLEVVNRPGAQIAMMDFLSRHGVVFKWFVFNRLNGSSGGGGI